MTLEKFDKRLRALGSLAPYRPINGVCKMFVEQCIKNQSCIFRDDDIIYIRYLSSTKSEKKKYIWHHLINGEDYLTCQDEIEKSIKNLFNDTDIFFISEE